MVYPINHDQYPSLVLCEGKIKTESSLPGSKSLSKSY